MDFSGWLKAPACAGVIHTDFERALFEQKLFHLPISKKHGSWNAAKEAGLVRTEGRIRSTRQ